MLDRIGQDIDRTQDARRRHPQSRPDLADARVRGIRVIRAHHRRAAQAGGQRRPRPSTAPCDPRNAADHRGFPVRSNTSPCELRSAHAGLRCTEGPRALHRATDVQPQPLPPDDRARSARPRRTAARSGASSSTSPIHSKSSARISPSPSSTTSGRRDDHDRRSNGR